MNHTFGGALVVLSSAALLTRALPAQAYTVAVKAGDAQSALVNTVFASKFQVAVANSDGDRAAAVIVTFTAPGNNASGSFTAPDGSAGGATATASTDADGIATSPAFVANASAGDYTVSVTIGGGQPLATFHLTNATAPVVSTYTGLNSPYTRIVAGYNVTNVSAAQPQGQYLVDAFLYAPLLGAAKKTRDDGFPQGDRILAWFNPRVSSTATASPNVAGIVGSTALATQFGGNLNTITQDFTFLGGIELDPGNGPWFGGDSSGAHYQGRLGIILAAGGTSSFNPSEATNLPVYPVTSVTGASPAAANNLGASLCQNNPSLQICTGGVFTPSATITDVAFVPMTRNRFNDQYYVGLRLKTFHVPSAPAADKEVMPDSFPGVFDLEFGQDEAVSGGRLHGAVMRLDAFYPVSFAGQSLYVFGHAELALSPHAVASNTLVLPTASTTAQVTDATTLMIPVAEPNADQFQIGLGIDLGKLVSTITSGH